MRIAAIPGDGIGTEVLPVAIDVLDAACAVTGVHVDWTWLDWGCEYFSRTGRMMPDDGLDMLAQHDAIFLGAIGRPDVPDHESLWGILIPIRQRFDQYINLRPIRVFEGLTPRVVIPPGTSIDMVVVRENTEGEYSEIGGRFARGTDREFVIQENVFTRVGVTRVAEFAFAQAERRAGVVTSATKSNGIIHTMPFWDEIVTEVAVRHPAVECTSVLIDALAAELVLRPHSHDVIVASNLFGDILSDLAAAVVGSLGIAPSGNLNPERKFPSMFEPVHGSAPDIAGLGVANPIAAVWSGAMMLEHLGMIEASNTVMKAVEASLVAPQTRTADLAGMASTAAVGSWLRTFIEGASRQ